MLLRVIMLSVPLVFMAYTKAQSEPLLKFENQAVEEAYYAESGNLTQGVFFAFESNNLPNEEEKKVMFDIAKQADLKELEVTEHQYVTVWSFDWPYWRSGEEGETVCEQFKEKAGRLGQYCNSSIRVLVWSD